MALTGFYGSHQGRGFHSAEVQALAKEGLDRSEIRRVVDWTEKSVTVETVGGRCISLGFETAKNLGIVR